MVIESLRCGQLAGEMRASAEIREWLARSHAPERGERIEMGYTQPYTLTAEHRQARG